MTIKKQEEWVVLFDPIPQIHIWETVTGFPFSVPVNLSVTPVTSGEMQKLRLVFWTAEKSKKFQNEVSECILLLAKKYPTTKGNHNEQTFQN